jgi:hypothetical protein
MAGAAEPMERPSSHRGDAIAALGGVVLLLSLLVPIEWFKETSTGGLTGQGTGEPPQSVSAYEAFGLWLVPVAAAAAMPVIQVALSRVSRPITARVRWVGVGVGIAVLVVGVVVELAYALPDCCDQIYTAPSVELGLIPAALGAAALALGTISAGLARPSRSARPRLP